jgi:N6-adenosine-specific RNA methylase IME4
VKRYKTIVIDPPWPGPGASPAFDAQAPLRLIPYHTMTGVQCAALNVRTVADDDAQIFLWTCSRSLGDAYLLLQTWAFSFRGLFIWKKPLGLGRHVRSEAEFLLWGGRHGAPMVEPTNCPRQIQVWKPPGGHSEKPEGAYDLIRELSVGPRLDVFARRRRDGFDAWGDDLPESEAVQGVLLMPNSGIGASGLRLEGGNAQEGVRKEREEAGRG